MPDCWIFLLKRRSALSNVSFSPTRTSAKRLASFPLGVVLRPAAARDAAFVRAGTQAAEVYQRPLGGSIDAGEGGGANLSISEVPISLPVNRRSEHAGGS